MSIDVERLAKELHEAGREAVERGYTVNPQSVTQGAGKFIGWDDVSEQAREGRRIQARYLLNKYKIEPFSQEVQEAAIRGFSGGGPRE